MAESEEPTTTVGSETGNETGNELSPQDQLADLTAKATAEYAVKRYSEAAELFSQASELQADINGDMAVENADLLYSYGKCLFHLAQQTSSVLGGTAASAQLTSSKEKKAPKKRKSNGIPKTQDDSTGSGLIAAALDGDDAKANVGDVVSKNDIKPDPVSTSDKPLFQIEGDDETWNDSDDEEGDEDPEVDGDEEDEDDFANAFELLDLARVLYLKKLESLPQSAADSGDKGKGVASEDSELSAQTIKKRIADIHDLQAEVSLESEKYAAAVDDLKSCLALKQEFEAPESTLLAECHYKLSLALEFNSQNQERDSDGNPVGELVIDWTIRNEAIEHQEKAIECCKLRIDRETKTLQTMEDGSEKDKAKADIEDVQDMVSEMEVRLADLRKPPVSVKAETEMKDQISGVLGSILGASAEEQKAKLDQVTAGAKDLSGLVKRKKPKITNGGDSGFGSAASTPAPISEPSTSTSKPNGKRKVEFADTVEELGTSKKAKVEEADDAGT